MIRKVAFGSFSVSFSSDDAEENGEDRRKKKRRKGVHEIGEHDSLSWLTASYGRWTSVSRCARPAMWRSKRSVRKLLGSGWILEALIPSRLPAAANERIESESPSVSAFIIPYSLQ